MNDKLWENLNENVIHADGTDYQLFLDREQIVDYYCPLANIIINKLENKNRFIVGIAGPPGSGKTAFASILALVINTIANKNIASIVSLDGWHFSNIYLENKYVKINDDMICLKKIKGNPNTYDFYSFWQFLKRVSDGGSIKFPKYSRKIHDPIQDAGQISDHQRIIIVEGNFLFLSQQPWNVLKELFSLKIFLDLDIEIVCDFIKERQLRGGRDLEYIEKQIKTVDIPNAQLITSTKKYADILIMKKDSVHIKKIINCRG